MIWVLFALLHQKWIPPNTTSILSSQRKRKLPYPLVFIASLLFAGRGRRCCWSWAMVSSSLWLLFDLWISIILLTSRRPPGVTNVAVEKPFNPFSLLTFVYCFLRWRSGCIWSYITECLFCLVCFVMRCRWDRGFVMRLKHLEEEVGLDFSCVCVLECKSRKLFWRLPSANDWVLVRLLSSRVQNTLLFVIPCHWYDGKDITSAM